MPDGIKDPVRPRGSAPVRSMVLFLLAVFIFPAPLRGAALQYLRIPVFAASEGMGGAYTSVSQDPGASVFYNPAGLVRQNRDDFFVAAGYADWIKSAGKGSFLIVLPSGLLSAVPLHALSIDYFTVAGLDAYDETGRRTGGLRYYDLSLGLNFGLNLEGDLYAGANVKYLNENIAGYKGHGASIDMGVLTDLPGDIRAGAAVSNFGFFFFNGKIISMPTIFRVGASYRPLEILLAGVDFELGKDKTGIHLGTEIEAAEGFRFRAGIKDTEGGLFYTMGGGFESAPPEFSDWGGQVIVNYSFTSGGNLETVNHMIDAGVRFSLF